MRKLPFVGRTRELERVKDFVQSTISQDGASILWLQGEAGIGKSRFLEEVQTTLSTEQSIVIYVRIYPDSATSIVSALGAAMRSHPFLKHYFPPESSLSSARIIDTLTRAVRLRPTLVMIDDVHLLDDEAAMECGDIIDSLSDEPIAFVCSARPGKAPIFSTLFHHSLKQMELGLLDQDDVRDILAECFGPRYSDESTVSRIYEATHGLPLIIRAALAESLSAEPGTDLYLGDVPTPTTWLQQRARLATDSLVASLMHGLSDEDRMLASKLALLGEVFHADAGARMLDGTDALLDRLVERNVLSPALGSPQPLFDEEIDHDDRVLSFTHTLLHEHFTSTWEGGISNVLDVLESGLPLFSIHPLLRLPELIDEDFDRALRIMIEFVERLADSMNRALAAPAYNAAVTLYDKHRDRFVESGGIDGYRLDFLRLRLQITSTMPEHPEFRTTLRELCEETLEPETLRLAEQRCAALEYSLFASDGTTLDVMMSTLDEADLLTSRFPGLICNVRYLRLLGTIAATCRHSPHSTVIRRLRNRIDTILELPHDQLNSAARRDVLMWVVGPMLTVFADPEDVDDRRELADRIVEEFGESPRDGRFLTLWPQFLEASGDVVRAKSVLAERTKGPMRGNNLPEELGLRLLVLSVDAALGGPLDRIATEAHDIVQQGSGLFRGSGNEVARNLIRSSVIGYVQLLGLLRGQVGWSRQVAGSLAVSSDDSALKAHLRFERAAIDGRLETLKEYLDAGEIPMEFKPLVSALVHESESKRAIVQGIRAAVRKPIFQRPDIVRLHVLFGLVRIALTRGIVTPATLKNEIRPTLIQALSWSSENLLAGYLDGLLKLDPNLLPREDRDEWEREFRLIEEEVSSMNLWQDTSRSVVDHRLHVSMMGVIGYYDHANVFHRISGSRARLVLGLLVAYELIGTNVSADDFRQEATGMETSDEAANYLRIIVSRLRRTLGPDSIITPPNGRPAINTEVVAVDAIEADNLIRQALDAVRRRTPREATDLLIRAFDIIGDRTLLPTLYEPVFENARSDFELRIREAVLGLVRRLSQEEDERSGTAIIRSALRAMPHDEELAEILTTRLQTSGRYIEALSAQRMNVQERG